MSCGIGIRSRKRQCMSSISSNDLFGTDCEGAKEEQEICEQPSCDCKIFNLS